MLLTLLTDFGTTDYYVAAVKGTVLNAEIPVGEAALIPGSLGTVEISLNGDDLARLRGVSRGAAVDITWNES